MTGPRLALEQFDTVKPPQLNLGTPTSGFGGHLSGDGQSKIDATPELAGIAPMGDPLIRPAPLPEEDPEQLTLDVLRQDLTQACARLADVVAAIEADRATAQANATDAAIDRVAAIGTAAMGQIVDQGFATEIAGAVAEIASQIPHHSAELQVAAEDHESLVTALAGFAPDTAISLISDNSLISGQAKMNWPDGGVDFDTTALAEMVATMMTERLSDLTTRSR